MNWITTKKVNYTSAVFLVIPLTLTAFTHLWNPVGFPSIHIDEGIYQRRALQILEILWPQDPYYPYDHPYFGQLFMAGIFKLIGYPDSLKASIISSVNVLHSIEMLYLVPRVLMGILAVADTFLVYKISERRYNRNVAVIASVLFAVMPLTWLIRRILLDSILLPFLLSSILFALYANGFKSNKYVRNIFISGIFLGLSIFTKVPAFVIIPLIVFLIYSCNRNMKTFGVWLTPVILISLIWPAYSIWVGQFDLWWESIIWQTHRSNTFFKSVTSIFQIDPILLIISVAGSLFIVLKRDLFLLLWIIPFIIFFISIGWIQYFHWILIFPAFCIAAARFIEGLSNRIISNKKIIQTVSPFAIISGIGVFGLVSTTMLITTNVNSSYFNIYASVVQRLLDSNHGANNSNNKVIVTGSHWWIWNIFWIPKYVFHKDIDIIDSRFDPLFKKPFETQKVLFIVDLSYRQTILKNPLIMISNNTEYDIERLQTLYNNSNIALTFVDNLGYYDPHKYPYTSMQVMTLAENRQQGRIDIRTNY